MKRRPRYTTPMSKTALRYVLEALIPYTEANLKLVFKPSAFFNYLDRAASTAHSRSSLRNAYYEAKSAGYIVFNSDNIPELTDLGKRALTPHIPKLVKHSCVMVIFDIPENERAKRQYLRMLLRELHFTQTQQSVWTSQFDCKDILVEEINAQRLELYVQVYETARIV